MQWKYSDMEASATRPLPPASPPAFAGTDDGLVKGRSTLAGTPGEIVEALLKLRERAQVPLELVARSHLPLLGYTAQADLMQELAEDVAPHV
jgi:hypothetical protein